MTNRVWFQFRRWTQQTNIYWKQNSTSSYTFSCISSSNMLTNKPTYIHTHVKRTPNSPITGHWPFSFHARRFLFYFILLRVAKHEGNQWKNVLFLCWMKMFFNVVARRVGSVCCCVPSQTPSNSIDTLKLFDDIEGRVRH